MKIWQKIAIVSCLLLSIIGILSYDSFHSAPSRFSIRYEDISSIYIPNQLNEARILFFSDLHYGSFMDKNRCQKLVDSINGLAPDVVVFGGDLLDHSILRVEESTYNELKDLLQSINAPLGKFAVLGDYDCQSEEKKQTVINLLKDAEFELLENRSIKIRNTGSESISLTGLANGLNDQQDINSAFSNVSRTTYNIVVCHTPDSANNVPTDLTKYFLAGHSLGGQAYWLFGALYTPAYAENYFRGKHEINSTFTLDITNGVGTIEKDVRFLSNAEIVLYRLQHKSITDTAN